MLRQPLLAAARNDRIKEVVSRAPVSRSVVRRFVAGETVDDAVRVTRELLGAGMSVSLDHLGEDTAEVGQAETTTKAYLALLDRLATEGLATGRRAEVSVKLSAVGQLLDEELATGNARLICAAAAAAGTTVTLDMEGSATTDSTLAIHAVLRREFPDVAAVIQSTLTRSEADCRDLAAAGSRVRLCKGAYAEEPDVAFAHRAEIDKSYVRCLRALFAADSCYPMVATHDPRLIAITGALTRRFGRSPGQYEYQLLYGVRPDEQRRLAEAGETVRVYVPYGDQWYGYLMRRLAERPANVAFFLRALATRG